MRIIKHRIYGRWDSKDMWFQLYDNGKCEIYWRFNYDKIKYVHNFNKVEKGGYEIINNKLILKFGENHEYAWMTEILYLYDSRMELLHLHGDRAGVVDNYTTSNTSKKHIEEKWYHSFIGIPKNERFNLGLDIFIACIGYFSLGAFFLMIIITFLSLVSYLFSSIVSVFN